VLLLFRNTFAMCADESNRREALAAGALAVVVMYEPQQWRAQAIYLLL
jgi:hypothetical protein